MTIGCKRMDTWDKQMSHIPGGMQQDSPRFYHNTPNGTQSKSYKLFTSGISYVIFSDKGGWQVIEPENVLSEQMLMILYKKSKRIINQTFHFCSGSRE